MQSTSLQNRKQKAVPTLALHLELTARTRGLSPPSLVFRAQFSLRFGWLLRLSIFVDHCLSPLQFWNTEVCLGLLKTSRLLPEQIPQHTPLLDYPDMVWNNISQGEGGKCWLLKCSDRYPFSHARPRNIPILRSL